MPLIRRSQKPPSSSKETTDVENRGTQHLRSSSKKTNWASDTWNSFQRRRRVSQGRWMNALDSKCHLSRILVVLGVILWVVVVRTAPPGRNYGKLDYWRLSHSLPAQTKLDLRNHFPIRIDVNSTTDMEDILHPGVVLGDRDKLDKLWGRKVEGFSISAPKFWDPKDAFGDFRGGVREFLGHQGRYLITASEASAIGSFYQDQETIYLSIASYRDPECKTTLESAFARASHPERLRVAIVDQRRTDEKDPSCRPPNPESCENPSDNILCDHLDRIDYIEYDATLMVGPVFARHIANRMYRGEYFSMQVDAHVRFAADWDEDIIEQWKSTGNEMAVLSSYMMDLGYVNFDPVTHASLNRKQTIMCDLEYEWTGASRHINFKKQPANLPKITESPMLQPFWAAGFSFSRGHFTVSVPYDHYLPFVFQGEEILQTIRGFTFGYDYYSPVRNVAYHIYAKYQNAKKRNAVPKYIENIPIFGPDVKTKAYTRLIGISGTSDPPPDYFHLEEERYGLGHVRSREQFFRTFGIHPSTTTVENDLCSFVRGSVIPGAPGSMHARFTPFLRYDKMGIDYTRFTFHHEAIERATVVIDEGQISALRGRLQNLTKVHDPKVQGKMEHNDHEPTD